MFNLKIQVMAAIKTNSVNFFLTLTDIVISTLFRPSVQTPPSCK